MEDAIQIGLNLKQVRFKVEEDKDYTVTLSAKGEGEVTGADLDTPSGIEVVNEDTSILTLTNKDAELNMELTVSTGYGLESSEERKEEKLPIGTISLDAFYSPVRKVSYDIEEMRIGERTDYNKIIMTVKTDGTIEPEEAFQNAAKILKKQFTFLEEEKLESEEEEKEEKKEEKKQKPKKKAKKSKSASDIAVEELELPTRVVNILKDNRIKTAAGLTQRKKETLADTEGLGEKSVEKIDKALSKYDLELK
jgi:DNA-directed RNA polymerase subunit alpha